MRLTRLGILAFILGLALPAVLMAAAKYPFPPTASWTYDHGIKPANPAGASWSADWTTLATKWTTYKNNYLSAANGGDRIICNAQQSGDTVSEGIGYGMILAVYFNDQTTFNNLWTYEQAHLDSLGLMNWDISSSGAVIGANSASDGDEDMAYALWLAHYQWGDSPTDYTTLAQNQTTLVQDNDLDGNLRIKPGDSFDSCEYPSYFMPNEYTVFGYVDGNSSTWNTVSSNCYQTINDACNTTSGLIAEQTGDTGTGGGCAGVSTTEDQYNSCRVPFYMTLDYVYNGTANAQTEMNRLAGFFNGIGPGSVDDCYTVNVGGTSSACSTNINHSAFIGPAGCALMVSSTYASSLQTYYNYLMALGTTSYFDDSWNLLSLLLMQGNMPNIADPAAIYTPTATETVTPYAGTPTPTPTITPIANGVVFEDFEYGQLASGYTFAYTGSSVTQTVTSTQANTGLYSDELVLNVVKGASYQYGGGGFNSNYANDQGVVNASGTTSLNISFKNTGTTAITVYVDFKEGGTTTTAVAGGHGYQWDSPPQVLAVLPGWQHFSIPITSFTWDTSNNPTTTPPSGDTGLVLTSVMTCQIQTNAVWAGTVYVDDVDFMPTVAFTPTATATPLNNPYTQIWDDFESPLSLAQSPVSYRGTTADAATGASASWSLTMTAGDFVDGTHGGALIYNTGTSAGWGCDGDDISPYSNAQQVSNDSGAAFLAFWIKAPAGFRYQTEFQEAGVLTATVQGADGAAWLSAMQTAAPDSSGWQYVELPISDFIEDPYDTVCNPNGILPSPCLSEGDTQQTQALNSVSFKLASGQGSGVLYFDDIAFITTWKTPTPSPSPSASASFTRSPSPTNSPSPTASPSPTRTDSPTATASDTPTDTATDSPTDTATASPSATATASPSATASPTDTATASPTATATHSPTGTPSATTSPTFTNVPAGSTATETLTISPTFTASPSDTLTASPTASPSSTDTRTGTPSASPSDSPTLTASLTASPTSTASPSATATWTFSPGPSPTGSDTATVSTTPSSSPTASPTATATWTFSAGPSPTGSDTPTASPTASPTGSPSSTATVTWTYSAGPSPSDTAAATATQSFTPTATPSQTAAQGSATPTPQVPVVVSITNTAASVSGGYTITVTGTNVAAGAVILFNGQPLSTTATVEGGGVTVLTATAPAAPAGAASADVTVGNPATGSTPPWTEAVPEKIITFPPVTATTSAAGNVLIVASAPMPNPNPGTVMVNLALQADSVQLKVFSSAFRLVGTFESGAEGPGWVKIPLPAALASAPNGVYYYLVSASRNGNALNGPKVGKLYILK